MADSAHFMCAGRNHIRSLTEGMACKACVSLRRILLVTNPHCHTLTLYVLMYECKYMRVFVCVGGSVRVCVGGCCFSKKQSMSQKHFPSFFFFFNLGCNIQVWHNEPTHQKWLPPRVLISTLCLCPFPRCPESCSPRLPVCVGFF